MGGGLIQLVAYGAQDMYLTGNPQITFFKVVYRRHTNFAIESIKQLFNGTPNFGEHINTTISRSGDLLYRMYLQTKLPAIDLNAGLTTGTQYRAFRWLNWVGHVLIKNIELSIGGQLIDQQTGEWLHIWNELTQTAEHAAAYAEMVGNVPRLTQIQSSNSGASDSTGTTDSYTLYIPMQFWFCRHAGLALPIISLQYSDVKLNIQLRSLDECIWATKQDSNTSYQSSTGAAALDGTNKLSDTYLYVDYIFLDTAERRRFAQVQHEYLIEQTYQTKTKTISTGETSNTVSFKFNHPVKELIWLVQPETFFKGGYSQSRGGKQWFNYTDCWDYSGFSGTPSGYYGGGMKGGRDSCNVFSGFPTVTVSGALNKTGQASTSWASTLGSHTTLSQAGYDNVSNYTSGSSTNLFKDRTMEQLLGPNLAEPITGNKVGLWSGTNNDLKIIHGGNNPVSTAKIQLNGNDRFGVRDGFYFNVIQPYQHHTSTPAPGINVYSFSLKPEDYQPSGTCNFSRIDQAQLILTLTSDSTSGRNCNFILYCLNYNILRIMSGMGGLAYSA
jgi:hypothetical protein